ncbi:guanine nucleotide binding protein, alpha subunit [Zopfochytrium polystomum]|nr:guanine nucleotide binding protein, alpha subunit [Zopfochytrium polystomum]
MPPLPGTAAAAVASPIGGGAGGASAGVSSQSNHNSNSSSSTISHPGTPTTAREALAISKQIDAEIKMQAKRRAAAGCTVLLLGTSDAGKSTILKQIRLHAGVEFTAAERDLAARALRANLFATAKRLVAAMRELGIAYGGGGAGRRGVAAGRGRGRGGGATAAATGGPAAPRAAAAAAAGAAGLAATVERVGSGSDATIVVAAAAGSALADVGAAAAEDEDEDDEEEEDDEGGEEGTARARAAAAARVIAGYDEARAVETGEVANEVVEALQALWADVGVQWCAKRGNEAQLMDSCEFLMTNFRTICSPTFTPTNQQMLHARTPTLAVSETHVRIHNADVTVIDVGGQARFRAKWAPFFDGVAGIIFVTSLNCYDQTVVEEDGDEMEQKGLNRMVDALSAFSSVCNHPLLRHIPIILFLNKCDLFARKIKISPIEHYFPDYNGGPSTSAASAFFLRKFLATRKGDPQPHHQHPASSAAPSSPSSSTGTLSPSSSTFRNGSGATRILSHFTWATDTAQMSKILGHVTRAIVLRNIDTIGV